MKLFIPPTEKVPFSAVTGLFFFKRIYCPFVKVRFICYRAGRKPSPRAEQRRRGTTGIRIVLCADGMGGTLGIDFNGVRRTSQAPTLPLEAPPKELHLLTSLQIFPTLPSCMQHPEAGGSCPSPQAHSSLSLSALLYLSSSPKCPWPPFLMENSTPLAFFKALLVWPKMTIPSVAPSPL